MPEHSDDRDSGGGGGGGEQITPYKVYTRCVSYGVGTDEDYIITAESQTEAEEVVRRRTQFVGANATEYIGDLAKVDHFTVDEFRSKFHD